MKFSIEDFFSKGDQVLNGKLHFLFSDHTPLKLLNTKKWKNYALNPTLCTQSLDIFQREPLLNFSVYTNAGDHFKRKIS